MLETAIDFMAGRLRVFLQARVRMKRGGMRADFNAYHANIAGIGPY